MTKRWIGKTIVPAVLIATGWWLLRSDMDSNTITVWMESFGDAAPIVFVLVGVVLMSVMVPKTVVSIAAGALFGTALGTALMLFTAVIAAVMNYFIGRWWLAGMISEPLDRAEGKGKDNVSGRDEWIQMVGLVAHEAGLGIHLLVRLTPVPTMVISYLMGACRAKLAPFTTAAALAIIPQSLWVHSGTAVRLMDDPTTGRLHWVGVMVSVVAAIAVGIVVPRTAMRRLRSRRDPN